MVLCDAGELLPEEMSGLMSDPEETRRLYEIGKMR